VDVATIRRWVERRLVPDIDKRYVEPDLSPGLAAASLSRTFTGFPPIVETYLSSIAVNRVDEP
jgi:hypothetical protein